MTFNGFWAVGLSFRSDFWRYEKILRKFKVVLLFLFASLITFVGSITSVQAATVQILQNNSFTSGTTNNWTNWTFSATGAQTAFNGVATNPGPNLISDSIGTLNVTQSGLSGLNSGPGALGAGLLTLNLGWNTCGTYPSSVQVYVGGTLYATFTTPPSAGNGATTATTSYSNSATGSAGSTIPSSPFVGWTYYPWTINLPTSVAANGDLKISFVTTQQGCDADISLRSVTLQVYRPTLTLSKTSVGGVGSFTFTGDNGWSSQTITTSTAETAQTGATQTLAAAATSTTITETIPSGYVVSAISCTGLASGGTATTNLSSGSVTLDAAATVGNGSISCSYTNTKLPTVQISKTSNGGTGSFSFSGTNGFGSDTVTTSAQGTAVNGTVKTLSAVNTATTLTETIPSTYFLSSISCSGLGSGTASYDLGTGTASLDSAATAAGNVITCSYTNTLSNPSLSVVKSSSTSGPVSAGQVITYTYTVTNNGNRPMSNVAVGETFNGTGTQPTPANEILVTDSSPTGDSSDTTANNGVWSTLGAGDQVKFTANYTVTQQDVETLQ